MKLLKRLLLAVALVAVGAFLALSGSKAFSVMNSETLSSKLINSVVREEQVVLLSLGIQGLDERNEAKAKLFGLVDVPGSERTKFIEYSFKAKLGLDGKDVGITQIRDNEFLVSIPNFIFIGHDSENFRLVAERNGVLSWATPEIDSVDMINKILSDEARTEYIELNEEILRDQAKLFYGGIIGSVAPDVVVKFEFRD